VVVFKWILSINDNQFINALWICSTSWWLLSETKNRTVWTSLKVPNFQFSVTSVNRSMKCLSMLPLLLGWLWWQDGRWAENTHDTDQKFIQNFGQKTWRKELLWTPKH
jgi:hypothetical protein